jgi:hypothetical protein
LGEALERVEVSGYDKEGGCTRVKREKATGIDPMSSRAFSSRVLIGVSCLLEKGHTVSALLGLSNMMIYRFGFLLVRHLIAMHMTVRLMVIDTQDMLAVRKHAFSALSRSL